MAVILVPLLALAAAVAAWGADWRLIAARWHAWRADRSRTYAEALPWLERLAEDAREPRVSAAIVADLGPERQYLTFWLFQRLVELCREEKTEDKRLLFPDRLGTVLPIVREMGRRAGRDERFLALWAYYVRWRGPQGWQVLGDLSQPQRKAGVGGGLAELLFRIVFGNLKLDFSAEILECAGRQPEAFECAYRLSDLEVLGEAFALGMDPLPRLPDFKLPRSKEEIDAVDDGFDFEKPVKAWLREHREELASRRDEILTPPPLPFPGWRGPSPER